ncbi:hypothetical protein [Allopusillimonas ginsengisoli]|uniref:hypothetical protein n=1 Tax=Allopusillimonas ginsengisoli TaxID=453575 RepID=UPI00102145A8|nr:hypothetical protein [Allopusillimonas ginsengisoli]TEA79482.1 hypothetical protein ERE07_00530 [Allopusillimonas ginsengisoli]
MAFFQSLWILYSLLFAGIVAKMGWEMTGTPLATLACLIIIPTAGYYLTRKMSLRVTRYLLLPAGTIAACLIVLLPSYIF